MTGRPYSVAFPEMGRRSKKDKPPAIIRGVLAQNVRVLRDRKWRDVSTATARNRKLAEAADTTLSQVQRVLAKTLGTSVDLVEQLANAMDVRPQDLLTPYFYSIQKPEVPSGDHNGDCLHRISG